MKFLNQPFSGEPKQRTILFLNLDTVLKSSIPGEFVYIRQIELVGIIALQFEGTRIYFESDIVASIAVEIFLNKVSI